jgi:hypothetical protein
MCFTPKISFMIFAIEWILGFLVLFKSYRTRKENKKAYNLSAIILFCLGLYQFTQYMFCTSGNVDLWSRIGFLAYNLLPALGLHLAVVLTNNKQYFKKIKWYYLIPLAFSSYPLLSRNFLSNAECSTYFIIAEHSWSNAWAMGYMLYYSLFIILSALMLWDAISKAKGNGKKALTASLVGILAFTIPVLVLIILLPQLKIAFPSILCEFALLYGICVFVMIYFLEKR